jgi:glycosyltransferase involved in cell wall biosynthesis
MSELHKYDVSIVIPCYQEEHHILKSVEQVYKVMNVTRYKFEVIFVDDASTDKTREKILQIAKEFSDITYLFHEINTGKGKAISDGTKIAQGKYVGHIDIDLEVSAEYLPKVLAEIENGNDIALIKRKVNFSKSPQYIMRDIAGSIHRSLVKRLLNIPHTDIQSGCKFFKRDVLLTLLKKTESTGWFFDAEILARAYYSNYRIKQIPGFYIRNKNKKSTVKLFQDGIKQLKELFEFSKKIRKERDGKKL